MITKMLITLVLDMIETSFKNWQTQDIIPYNIFALFYIRGPRVTANIAKILQQRKFPSLQYVDEIFSGQRESRQKYQHIGAIGPEVLY